MRDAVRRVNAFLAKADIEFLEDGLSPMWTRIRGS